MIKLSEKDFEKLKTFIFEQQKKHYRRNCKPLIKRSGMTRKESNKMLYADFVLIEE